MTRKLYGPFNRVEGDLEVEVEITEGKISKAWVNSPLYRGFEQIMQGKSPLDTLVYVPRICGICSVSQSIACAEALADAQGIQAEINGQLASNIILACENLADHLTHFYLFFMPDFARKAYQDQPWYPDVELRFRAQTGTAATTMLRARAEFIHITGILAGKWPHSLSIQPGGTTTTASASDKVKLLAILMGFRQFLETQLFDDSLENICELENEDALRAWAEQHSKADFAQFLHLSDSLELHDLGKIDPNFMSYGAYRQNNDFLFPKGRWTNEAAGLLQLDSQLIREDLSHSWMLEQQAPAHPLQGVTIPDAEQAEGYSWCKAPRYDGSVIEVGALARQTISQHPLLLDLVSKNQSNVTNRIVARLLELARVLPEMENWCRQLQPNNPFCHQSPMPTSAEGQGMVEAARGSLGHWIRIEQGKISNYQIIAPTTWNFSPRDKDNIAGALEQALLGTAVGEGGNQAIAIQHIVRSFDPCMVCTVH
ncbi:MAG: nickel-dependent hydrogenase large subunit [Methylophaga sp.]|nr:nickel-dependent hydrogenase large subunit [Methylophaga sp.]